MYFRLTAKKEEVVMAGKGGNSLLEGALPDLVLEMGYHFTSRYTTSLPGIPLHFQVYHFTSRYTRYTTSLPGIPGIPLHFQVYQVYPLHFHLYQVYHFTSMYNVYCTPCAENFNLLFTL